MKCERAMEILAGPANIKYSDERESATRHVAECQECRDAIEAVHALRLASLVPIPSPPPGGFERALAAATRTPTIERQSTRRFWAGMGVGAALAASLAIVAFTLLVTNRGPDAVGTPELALMLDVPRVVSISLSTESALDDAEIRVSLRGAVDLDGYAGERTLAWRTNLAAGVNQLSLPVIATGPDGGQLLVEVLHGGKRRSFLVDVKARV